MVCQSQEGAPPLLHDDLYKGLLSQVKMPDKGVLKTKAFPGSSAVQVVETAVGDCTVESVVVYKDRAEVKRAVPVHLYPGENEVIVYDLAECVDKSSIR